MSVQSYWQVLAWTLLICVLSVIGVHFHVRVNYPPEMQGIVWPRAVTAAFVITFIISSVTLLQVRRIGLLSRELQRLVDRDRLTDVATRDFFFSQMQQHPEAYGTSLMVDIDHFKRINDNYGHMAGDAVIRAVAQILRKHVRTEDIVCRFGGEEFVIFLFEKGAADGQAVADRMRSAIETTEIAVGDIEVSVTVSIGGSLKDRLEGLEEAIQQADTALYQAKRAGRNTTVFYSADLEAPAPRKAG